MRTHIKEDENGKVIMKEIHKETLPPDIRGAMWWLERRFPEQFGRRDQMGHTGGVTEAIEQLLNAQIVLRNNPSAPDRHALLAAAGCEDARSVRLRLPAQHQA